MQPTYLIESLNHALQTRLFRPDIDILLKYGNRCVEVLNKCLRYVFGGKLICAQVTGMQPQQRTWSSWLSLDETNPVHRNRSMGVKWIMSYRSQ